jgi:hypothetical protein
MAPPRTDEDWSDSDSDDGLSQVETSVLLGVPDGTVETEADRIDAAVSRIGGLPVRASPVVVVPCAQVLTSRFYIHVQHSSLPKISNPNRIDALKHTPVLA